MKKGIFTAVSILIIVAIIGAVGFVVWMSFNGGDSHLTKKKNSSSEPDAEVSTQVAPTQYSDTYKIGIVQTGLGSASKDCYSGFMIELDERGLMGNLDIEYVVEDNEELCRSKIQELVDGGCDLLYTIGRFASDTAAEITDEIPIVFGAVNSPEQSGLVASNQKPGGNVTGVSSYTPCFEQIDLIPILLPDATSVAVMYSGTDQEAVSQGIIASAEAKRIGLTDTTYIIEDKASLKASLDKIKKAKSSVIYIPVDKFLSANIDTITAFSYENKIPIICGDEATLSKGAFATSEINYVSIGKKAAGMAVDILFEKKEVSTLSVMYKHDCTNMVNKAVRDKLGIELPATALGEIEMWETPTEPPAASKPTAAPAATKSPS